MERRLRRVLDAELDLLGRAIASEERRKPERPVDPGRDPGRAQVLAVQHDPLVGRDRPEILEEVEGRPVRRGLHALQEPGRPADQRTGADRVDVAGLRGPVADERQDRLVVHQRLLPGAARHDKDVEWRRLRKRPLGREDEALDVPDRRPLLPQNVDGRPGHSGEHLERAGEVDLVHAREDDDADVHVGLAIRSVGGKGLPRAEGSQAESPSRRETLPEESSAGGHDAISRGLGFNPTLSSR
jgi:hypothetical protein